MAGSAISIYEKLATAQSTLDELTREQIGLMSQESNTEQLECQPTPVAKAVTGKEVHVLLSDDHVAIVPFDELLDQMKADAKANVWRMKQQTNGDARLARSMASA